jgi:hypothetical protein
VCWVFWFGRIFFCHNVIAVGEQVLPETGLSFIAAFLESNFTFSIPPSSVIESQRQECK